MPLVTDAQPEDIVLPDWGEFKLAMLQNGAYQRVTDRSKNQRAVSRLESQFTAELDNWQVAAMLWQQMIAATLPEEQPLPDEVEQWRAIAQQTNMPIAFNDGGYLVPDGDGDGDGITQ